MRNVTCRSCGTIAKRCGQAVYCMPCARKRNKTRLAAPERVRAGDYKRRKVNGVYVCVECDAVLKRYGTPPRGGAPLRCYDCNRARYHGLGAIRGRAHSAVAKAIREGRLPKAASQVCVDCGREAEVYDHRDYSRVLDVDAVCRSCNIMRGPGLMPIVAAA